MVSWCMVCSVFGLPFLNLFLMVNPAHMELPLSPSSSPRENKVRIVPIIAHARDRAAHTSELPPLQSGDQSVCPQDFHWIK